MQLKSYYNHCLLKHKKTTRIDKEINTRIENIEINQPIINEKNFEGNFGTDLLIENEDLFQEDFCDFNIENVNEQKKYLMQIICDFFKKAPETEAYFIDIILLLKKAFNLIKNKSVLNAKSALLKIDFKNLIKKGKEMVESIKITNHDEILISNDETEGDIKKEINNYFTIYLLKKQFHH